MKDWLRLLGIEISVALALGLAMALAVAVVATVLFGSLAGMSLPFLPTRFRMDPATASAPLITSIADIGGVLINFSIATWWLMG